jgi:hypothetical protein
MAQFRKKPVVIDAMVFPGISSTSLKMLDQMVIFEDWLKEQGLKARYRDNKLIIPTLEGELTASPGDWIIKGTAGEFYPCKPHVFSDIYEPANLSKDWLDGDERRTGCVK